MTPARGPNPGLLLALGMALAVAHGACDSGASGPAIDYALPPEASWATRSDPPPAAVGELVLITNNFEDTVSYVDLGLDPPREIYRGPVGFNPVEREGPHHVAVGSGGTYWIGISNFVPGSGSGPHGAHGTGTADGYAMAYAIADNTPLGSVRVDRNPGDIRVTPDKARVLLTHFDLLRITEAAPGAPETDLYSRLAIIDAATMKREAMVATCPAAHGMVISPDSRRVTIACWDDRLAIVDLVADDHPVVLANALPLPGTIADPVCQPYALTQSPDGGTIWIGCFASGELRAFDTARGAPDPARKVDLGAAALFGSYLDDGTIVVASQGPDRVTWIRSSGPGDVSVVATLDVAPADCVLPHVVAPSSDGTRLLLVCEGNRVDPGTLVVIDPITRQVTQSIPVGRFPDDLALVPKAAP